MQQLLKSLIAELHIAFFKPNGFKKERNRFLRVIGATMQAIEFQSSRWNSSDGPISFYINILIGFNDIPMKDGEPALTGSCRLRGLVSDAPMQFDLTSSNYDETRNQLLSLLPLALSHLPKHYEGVRSRAKSGWHTRIPVPET